MSQSFPDLESCIPTFAGAKLWNVCSGSKDTSAQEKSKEQGNGNSSKRDDSQ